MSENHVLLVDDEEEFVQALAKRLRARGLNVETASDGSSALEKMRGSRFHAVVLDLAMPGMDGVETLRRIIELDAEAQVILLTGHGTVHAGVEAMKIGARDFLEKPAEFSDLMDKIREAIRTKLELTEQHSEDKVADILRKHGW